MNKLNQAITHIPVPEKMRRLKISDKGFPIPWFVDYVNGKADFRCMDGEKFGIAIRHKRCWLCGEQIAAKSSEINPEIDSEILCAKGKISAAVANNIVLGSAKMN